MPQSLSQNFIHLVFSTKNRHPFCTPDIQKNLYPMMIAVSGRNKCHVEAIGGVADHVHLALRLHPTLSLSQYVGKVKSSSSLWVKTLHPSLQCFSWQSGYGAFSVSLHHLPALKQYIEDQEAHHHKKSFQDEFREICRKNHVQLDERYVWE